MTNGIIPRLVQPKHEFYNDPFIMTCHGVLYCTFYWLSHLPLSPQNPFFFFFLSYSSLIFGNNSQLIRRGQQIAISWCSRVWSFLSWWPTAKIVGGLQTAYQWISFLIVTNVCNLVSWLSRKVSDWPSIETTIFPFWQTWWMNLFCWPRPV